MWGHPWSSAPATGSLPSGEADEPNAASHPVMPAYADIMHTAEQPSVSSGSMRRHDDARCENLDKPIFPGVSSESKQGKVGGVASIACRCSHAFAGRLSSAGTPPSVRHSRVRDCMHCARSPAVCFPLIPVKKNRFRRKHDVSCQQTCRHANMVNLTIIMLAVNPHNHQYTDS